AGAPPSAFRPSLLARPSALRVPKRRGAPRRRGRGPHLISVVALGDGALPASRARSAHVTARSSMQHGRRRQLRVVLALLVAFGCSDRDAGSGSTPLGGGADAGVPPPAETPSVDAGPREAPPR